MKKLWFLFCALFMWNLLAGTLEGTFDITADRATVVIGVQSQVVATATQPSYFDGWEHGPHLDWALSSAVYTLSTNLTTRLFDDTGTRWIDGTGGVWQVSAVTNSTMANWTVTVISDIKNGSGTVVATNGTLEVFSDPIGVPPLALSQYAIQNVVHGGYRWSIYRASDASQLTVFVQNIGLSASQYLSQNMNPPTYTNAICTAWPGGLSSGQCRVTYTPIVYTVSVVTNALPRVAFLDDVPSTSGLLSTTGDGSRLTGITAAQISGLPSGGSSASALVPIVNVATGAVTTVTVSPTNLIYYIESASQTTITNILPALNCSSNLTYTIRYNATTTNALDPVWDPRMQFAGGTPYMTCTGMLEIVCQSACGTVIRVQQTWPTKYLWQSIGMGAQNTAYKQSHEAYRVVLGAAVSNSFCVMDSPFGDTYSFLRFTYLPPTEGSTASVTAGVGYSAAPPAASLLATTNALFLRANAMPLTSMLGVPPKKHANDEYLYFVYLFAPVFPAANVVLRAPMTRKMDENETAYFSTGGRAFR